jgi:hypothetical protein
MPMTYVHVRVHYIYIYILETDETIKPDIHAEMVHDACDLGTHDHR